MWIEFAGMAGAGKSTLAAAVKAHLWESGYQVLSPKEAVGISLERSSLGRVLARLLPARARQCLTAWVYRHILARLAGLHFRRRHPGLFRSITASASARSSLPAGHQDIILDLFYEVAAAYQFLRSRLQPGEVVLLDEGFVQRAINLFAWETGELNRDVLADYYRSLPGLDLLVIVQAPLDVCLERAAARGLPQRLRDKDAGRINQFMENSAEIIQIASETLSGQQSRVIELSNVHPVEETFGQLQRKLKACGLFRTKPVDAFYASPDRLPEEMVSK